MEILKVFLHPPPPLEQTRAPQNIISSSFEITKFSRNYEAPRVWSTYIKEWLTDNSQIDRKNRKGERRRKIGGNKKIGEMGDREIRGK